MSIYREYSPIRTVSVPPNIIPEISLAKDLTEVWSVGEVVVIRFRGRTTFILVISLVVAAYIVSISAYLNFGISAFRHFC